MFMDIGDIDNLFSLDSIHQVHTNPHEPTFTIIIVIMHAIPNRTLQQLDTIKINNRNCIINGELNLNI